MKSKIFKIEGMVVRLLFILLLTILLSILRVQVDTR